MNDTKDALEQARRNAQLLHKIARDETAKKHADIRANLEKVADDALRLQATVKVLKVSQQADAQQHLKNAENALDDAAQIAKSVKTANERDLSTLNAALRLRTAIALKQLSQALAAKRTSLKGRAPQFV